MTNDRYKKALDILPPILKKDLDQNLCVCNDVIKMDIIKAIVNGAITVEEVNKKTYAMDGNGCCTRQVKQLIGCLCSPETEE